MTQPVDEAQTDKKPPAAVVNGGELAAELGIEVWQIMRAVEVGAVPQRCTGKGWRREVADELAGRVPEILAAVEAAEAFGANRIAGVLAEAAGVEGVTRTDVELIVEAGHLVEVDEYKGWPLYSVQDAKQWAAEHADELVSMVAERRTWVEASMEIGEAAEELGWSVSEVQRMMRERGMNPGRFAVSPARILLC
uniref:hypothetical protein n=1 Tax=Streptomyces noursei TaxID=1971 RepID=UPI001594EE08|nr:hypothetical protein [Streptomyces noursei]